MTTRRTNHWHGVVAVALAAGAVGVALDRPLVLLSACVGVGYAVYPHLGSPPTVDVSVDRRLSRVDVTPGDEVQVTVAVTNDGGGVLGDLRVVDGPPAALAVTEGVPRHTAVLQPGETTEFEYTVEAAHGTHRFRPVTLVARDLTGAHEVETTVAPSADAVDCLTTLPDTPVDRDAAPFPGNVVTDESGEGLEFSRVREYRRGDEYTRIDWKRLARTGEMSTVEYRREQTVTAVVCVDARAAAYCGPDGSPHGVSYGVAAASELLASIWAVDERAGLAALGREFCWHPPGRGAEHEQRVRETLLSHPTLAPHPPSAETAGEAHDAQARALRARLRPTSQLFLVTPLSDENILEVTLGFAGGGWSVTVVSPDVSDGETPGSEFAALERRNRIHRLRQAGVRVVDWDPTTTLSRAVDRAERRWSR